MTTNGSRGGQKTSTVYIGKGDMSQNSKLAKMVLGRYYRVLNSRLTLTRLAILNTWKILL